MKPIINAGAACISKKGIWAIHYTLPILMLIDIHTARIQKTKLIPYECENDGIPYSAIAEANGRVYIFPCDSTTAWVYVEERDEFEMLEVGVPARHAFRGAFTCRDSIYAVPYMNPCMVRINTRNGIVSEIESFRSSLGERAYANSAEKMDDGALLCATPGYRSVSLFDVMSERWRRIDIKDDEVDITYASCSNGMIYGFDRNGQQVISFDYDGRRLARGPKMDVRSASLVALLDGGVAISDVDTGEIYMFDSSFTLMQQISCKSAPSILNSEYMQTYWVKDDDAVYGITKTNELLTIQSDGTIRRRTIRMEDAEWAALGVEYLRGSHSFMKESEFVDLSMLMKLK